jgi:hypothetical protein
MSPEFAVGITIAAFVLMVGICAVIAVVVGLDAAAAWPAKPRHRRSYGAQFWVRSEQADTAAIPVAGWSR